MPERFSRISVNKGRLAAWAWMLLALLSPVAAFAAPMIERVAGTGQEGENIPAQSLILFNPVAVAMDGSGALYIADRDNYRIRKVSPAGLVSTVAGNGVYGFAGDGGPATAAMLRSPSGIAVDNESNVYFSDIDTLRIRKVDGAGIITTIAGTGASGFSGDGGPATDAVFKNPCAIAVDSGGSIYVADSSNSRIRKIDPSNGTISTVAGSQFPGYGGDTFSATDALLNNPQGIAVDSSGNLYIADSFNRRLRKVDTNGIITRLAGTNSSGFSGDTGPATAATLTYPVGISVDSSGTVYFTDQYRIRKIDGGSGIINTIAGTGSSGFSGDGGQATSAALNTPSGIAVDGGGAVFIADTNNSRIRKIASGVITTFAGDTYGYSGDGGQATAAKLYYPESVAIDSSGNIYVADRYNQVIRKIAPSGAVSTVAGCGIAGYSGDGGPATAAKLNYPSSVAIDGTGAVLIADPQNNCIRRVDQAAGIIGTVAGTGQAGFSGDSGPATAAQLNYPYSIAFDPDGALYISDISNRRIRKISTGGIISTIAGDGISSFYGDGGPATAAELDFPYGITVDSSGSIFIADTYNNRIRKIDCQSGNISTVAGSGDYRDYTGDGGPATDATLNWPCGVSVDSSGAIFIADSFNSCIRKVDLSGTISTLAGNGTPGYWGDGGPASSAVLNEPEGIAVDSSGRIYIVDTNNSLIRRIDPDAGTTTTAATTTVPTGATTTTTVPATTTITQTTIPGSTTTTPGTTTVPAVTTTTTIQGGTLCPASEVLGRDDPDLDTLRDFRDSRLAKSAVGRKLIGMYYANAATVSEALEKSPALRAFSRKLLTAALSVMEK